MASSKDPPDSPVSGGAPAEFNRGVDPRAPASVASTALTGPGDDFDRRFLEYAYATNERLNSVSVAHALKLPIALCSDRLEALAAADAIHREVDDRGAVYYLLPGRADEDQALVQVGSASSGRGLARRARAGKLLGRNVPPPSEATALTGLIVNACVPGLGSIISGRVKLGLAQMGLLLIALPLCFVLVGVPLVFSAWIWSVLSGYATLKDAQGYAQELDGGHLGDPARRLEGHVDRTDGPDSPKR